MNAITKLMRVALVAAIPALSLSVHAQTAAPQAVVKPAAADMTEAEVRKVDKENKKITLKHGAIKNLDMPAMTMVFQVADPKMLDHVQAGDKIRFAATSEGGKITVTEIRPAN